MSPPYGKHPTSRVSMAALEFVKEHVDISQRRWQNIWWTDESEAELFGRTRGAASGEEGARKHQPNCNVRRWKHPGFGGWITIAEGQMISQTSQIIPQGPVRTTNTGARVRSEPRPRPRRGANDSSVLSFLPWRDVSLFKPDLISRTPHPSSLESSELGQMRFDNRFLSSPREYGGYASLASAKVGTTAALLSRSRRPCWRQP